MSIKLDYATGTKSDHIQFRLARKFIFQLIFFHNFEFIRKGYSHIGISNISKFVNFFFENLIFTVYQLYWRKRCIQFILFIESCRFCIKQNKQLKSRFSWCRRTGARGADSRRCWQPLWNLFPHSLHYGTMFATNWSSNGGLAAEASVTCRRPQWSNSSHFPLLFSPPKRFFCDMTTTPKLGAKDLLKAQRWVVERESNLLPLLYKLNSLTPIPSLPIRHSLFMVRIFFRWTKFGMPVLRSFTKKLCQNSNVDFISAKSAGKITRTVANFSTQEF